LGFLVAILLIVATIPIPIQASESQVYSTRCNVIELAVNYTLSLKDNGSYVEVMNGAFVTRLYKDGYDVFLDNGGNTLVYNSQFVLEYLAGKNWKQRGIPIGLDYEIYPTAILVTRHYSDYLGTTFDVIYSFTLSNIVKITIKIRNGQSSTYRLLWSLDGIKQTASYAKQSNSVAFDLLNIDWNDVYYSLGDITLSSVSDTAQGKKLDVTFDIGNLNAGDSLIIDPNISINSSSSDGYTYYGSSNWNTAWTATSGSVDKTSNTFSIGIDYPSVYSIRRAYLFFDTSSIPVGVTITTAKLYLFGASDWSTEDFNITVQNGMPDYPHDPIVGTDHNKVNYSGNGGQLSTVGFTTSGYNILTLNDDGKSWINAGGITKFCLRSDKDINNSPPSSASYVKIRSMEWAGSGDEPYLYVEYTIEAPTMQTNAATDVSYFTATLNGQITATGGQNASVRGFEWGTSTGNYSWSWNETGNYGIGAFSHGIDSLSVNTTYYFRAWAINDGGTGYGSELNFTTLVLSIPTVANSEADGITETSANFYGNITATGGENATSRGFEWGISTGNYTHDWHEDGSFGIGDFSHTFTDLPIDTTIYWLAYATNLAGTGYSGELNFTTLLPLPLAPTNFTATQTGISTANLTWVMGLYADDVYIRGKEGSAPKDMSDGYLIYSGNGTWVELTNLYLGLNAYYYKAWSSNPTGNSTDYAETNIGGGFMMFLVFAIIPLALLGFWVAKRDGFLAYAASGTFLLLAFMAMQQSSSPSPAEITDVYMGLFWIGMGMTITCALLPTLTREKVEKEEVEEEWEGEDMSSFGGRVESKVKPLTPREQYLRRINREARTGIVRTR